jgi:hypothetical protein
MKQKKLLPAVLITVRKFDMGHPSFVSPSPKLQLKFTVPHAPVHHREKLY